jgi:hypothetical protein
VREEDPKQSGSRLNGLRGLIFSIGLKNLGKTRSVAEQPEPSSMAPVAEPEPVPERTVVARSFTPFTEPVEVASPPVERKAAPDPEREVTTLPEFLPPKEFTPAIEPGGARETGSPSRSHRPDAFDELQTLPSRRGQYRTRS